MRLAPGSYQVFLQGGSTTIVVANDAQAAALETWLKGQQPSAIARTLQGGIVGQYKQTVRPSVSDGPWWLVSQNPDGTDFNITIGLATVASAMNQAIADGGNILAAASATAKNIDIFTTF